MILIADCGSTKIQWALVNSDRVVKEFVTTGVNAVVTPVEVISALFSTELRPEVDGIRVDELHFYGAGCIGDSQKKMMRLRLLECVDAGRVEVESDMLAAARALFGNRRGVACILGTGSNSCLYDGRGIVANVPPLGYILGDEGSGAVLGRRLVADVLKRELPEAVCSAFNDTYGLSQNEIIRRVYREPGANRFLASFAPFLNEHSDCPEIRQIVESSFESFFTRNVAKYPDVTRLQVGFVGSVASHFSVQLRSVAERMGFNICRILDTPISGLVKFHISF